MSARLICSGILMFSNFRFGFVLDIPGRLPSEVHYASESLRRGNGVQIGVSDLPYVGLVCSLFVISSQSNLFILRYCSVMCIIFIVRFHLADKHGECAERLR